MFPLKVILLFLMIVVMIVILAKIFLVSCCEIDGYSEYSIVNTISLSFEGYSIIKRNSCKDGYSACSNAWSKCQIILSYCIIMKCSEIDVHC